MIRIFLTGYMGSGKTTLGKALARKLNLSFIDTDWHIEERYHKTINELFARYGEAEFRELERRMLHEVGEFEDAVISTGGGVPCFFNNMEFMNAKGKTVFLEVHPDVLFQRLCTSKQSRPVLKDKTEDELRTYITEALGKRMPYYKQAQYVFNTDKLDNRWQIEEATEQLQKMLGITSPIDN